MSDTSSSSSLSIREGGRVRGLIGGAIVVLAIFLMIVVAYATRGKEEQSASSSIGQSPPQTARVEVEEKVEALVLRATCYTPCSTYIDYRFKIQRDGDPIRVIYPGVGPVEYRDKSDTTAPSQMRSGEVKFESLDPARPSVRVRVYQKVAVNKPKT